MKGHIPNIITLLNLFSGCIGIVMVFNGKLEYGAYFIWSGAILDFFDGFAARMLNVKSEIGKELDSLADMVSFGLLPSVILYVMLSHQTENYYLPYMAFLVAIFSALRLAKFNIDTRQTDSFIGLPTPANAFFISSLPFFISLPPFGIEEFLGLYTLITLTVVLSLALVTEMSLFSLKFAHFRWSGNQIRYIFVVLSALVFIVFTFRAFPIIISAYVLLSLFANKTGK